MAVEDEESRLERIESIEADTEVPRAAVVRRSSTFESFKFRDYTLFWSGALVSNMGSWMQNYALAIVVYSLRRSEFDSGMVQFVSGIPVLLFSLPAGALADRVDKRKLLIWSQVILLVQAVALGLLYNKGVLSASHAIEALVWIGMLGLLGGVMSALTFPSWQALLPDLVPRESLLNAIALNSAQFQSARLLGPLAAAGLVLVGAGMGEIFYVNAGSFLFVIAALWAIRPHPSHAEKTGQRPAQREGSMRMLTAGFTYAKENRAVGILILSTAVMTIVGMPYMMLLPAFADKVLHGAADGKTYTAYLMAANGLGAVVGSLGVASLPRTTRRERLIPWSVGAFALLLIAFSFTRSIAVALPISALAGAGVLTVNSLTNTSIQATVPQQLRGRVMALFIMSFMGLMPVSSLLFGALGKALGPALAIFIGALVLAGWALLLIVNKQWLEGNDAHAAERAAHS